MPASPLPWLIHLCRVERVLVQLRGLGVEEGLLFQPEDLTQGRNIPRVTGSHMAPSSRFPET